MRGHPASNHRVAVATCCVVLFVAPGVGAQSARPQTVATGLSALLTEQTPPPPGYLRDVSAAEATFRTVAGLFQVELSSIPVASSSGGFVYRFNPGFGTVERASDSFGPFFSERVLRNGEGHLSVGFGYQSASFTTLQGADLGAGSFPTNTARFAGQLLPFSVDTLSLTLEESTWTTFGSYGVTDRLDVGASLPFSRVRYSGRRVNTYLGQSTLQSQQSGSATGVGDIGLNARYRLTGTRGTGLAVGTDLRLPSGREQNLLGAGKTTWRFTGIASWERGIFAVHGNGGFAVGGISDEQFWAGAFTIAPTLRVTAVAELIGRRLTELNRVADVYQPHPVLVGIETMRWLPAEGNVHTSFLVTGVKWNVSRNWLLNTHVLTRLTEAGLRARFTPAIALDYALGF
jgi:hypothetical protein